MPTYKNNSDKNVTVNSLGGNPIVFYPGETKAIALVLFPHPDISIVDENPLAQDVIANRRIIITAGSTYELRPRDLIPNNIPVEEMFMYHLGDTNLIVTINGSSQPYELPPNTEMGFTKDEINYIFKLEIQNPGGSDIALNVFFNKYSSR